MRDSGNAVRELGWIQHAHLNATGKEENQTKTSFHPPLETHRHKYLIQKTRFILHIVDDYQFGHLGTNSGFSHLVLGCAFTVCLLGHVGGAADLCD